MGAEIRGRYVFGLALALGSAALGVTAVAVITTLASLHHAAPGSNPITIAGGRFTYPMVNGAGALQLTVGILGASVIIVAVRAAWRQARAYRRFIGVLAPVQSLARDRRVGVIPGSGPQAFCAGYLRPAIYVSRRTVELLSDAELDAVLAHEHHHRRVRDPLRIACGRILSHAVFFLPVLKALCDRYADVAELSADQAAVRASGGQEAPLASALLIFDESAPPGVSGISPERVDSLLGEPTCWRLPVVRLAGSLGALVVLSVAIWLISQSAAARATFNLPFLSSRPCVVMTSVLPLAGTIRMVARWVRQRT
jgi:hypothetical protein